MVDFVISDHIKAALSFFKDLTFILINKKLRYCGRGPGRTLMAFKCIYMSTIVGQVFS